MPFFDRTVPDDFEGTIRVDKFVSSVNSDITRSRLKTGITTILLNGTKSKLSTKVKAGDRIEVEWELNIPDTIEPQNIPLEIVYEDDDVAVINKKQGMVVHPAAGNWDGTLVNALLYHWGRKSLPQIKKGLKSEILLSRRPGIVHRLDKDTSGLIITAKNLAAEDWLQKQFQDHRVKKEYIAIVKGRPSSAAGSIITQIIRDPRNRKRFKAVTGTKAGKFAHTIYHCIFCYGNYSLMRMRLKTGRTHQIRVHMRYIGCPILGDPIYGIKDTMFPQVGLMLHSYYMRIRLPNSTQFTEFKSYMPERFLEVIKELQSKFPKEILSPVKMQK